MVLAVVVVVVVVVVRTTDASLVAIHTTVVEWTENVVAVEEIVWEITVTSSIAFSHCYLRYVKVIYILYISTAFSYD